MLPDIIITKIRGTFLMYDLKFSFEEIKNKYIEYTSMPNNV